MTRHRTAASLLVLLAAATTAGCSDSAAAPPRPAEPVPTSTSSAPTTPAETPEEIASEAALVAFEAAFDVGEQVGYAPAGDWESEIRKYLTDPAAAGAVQDMNDYVTYGIKQVGASTIEPQVTAVDLAAEPGPTVSIDACYDTTASDLVYAQTGVSIRPPDAEPELDRFWWKVTVVQMPGQPWLVSVIDPQIDSAC